MLTLTCRIRQGRWVLRAVRGRERPAETSHWSEDKHSPRLGPEERPGSKNPHAAGSLVRGPLTGGLATETLSCLSFEACPAKHGLAPRRPVDQGGLDRSTGRD